MLKSLQLILEVIVCVIQEPIVMELSKVNKGKFHQLVPCKYEHGIWVVGSSLVRHNMISGPLSDGPQIFSLLIMG